MNSPQKIGNANNQEIELNSNFEGNISSGDDESETEVEITPPDLTIQNKIGHSASTALGRNEVKRATQFLESMKSTLLASVNPYLNDIVTLTRARPQGFSKTIWQKAHEIRGIAGSAGRVSLGKFCNLICHYLEEDDETFVPNVGLISDLAVAAKFSMSDSADDDPSVMNLLNECETAIRVQMKREGRDFD